MATIIAAIIGAIATIVAALIALKAGKKRGRDEKEKEIDDAPRKYVDHLDKLIQSGLREGASKAIVNARAIVSTRNDLKNSMMRISEQLNSDIDILGQQLDESFFRRFGKLDPVVSPPDLNVLRDYSQLDEQRVASAAYETITVLAKKWPAKKAQIEVELRKVLAELGMLGKSPKRPKDE